MHLGRGKPVGLLVLARVLVLEIEVERSVGIVFEGHPAADLKPIESVRDLIALSVIKRDLACPYWVIQFEC